MRLKLAWLVGTMACAMACSGEISVENDVALAIVAPGDGARVTRADDVDPDLDGIQLNIVVDVAGAIDGTKVLLGTDVHPGAIASVVDGQAIFPSYTLPRGNVMLRATTRTCDAAACLAEAQLVVIDSDTKVAISVPDEGDVVGTGDVALTIVRTSGAMPTSCSVAIDGNEVGNFFWDNTAQPLVVASTLRAGTHVAQAFCYESLDTIPTQTVTFIVDGTAPTKAPALVTELGPGGLDFDTSGAFVNLFTSDASADGGLQHPVTVMVDSDGESHRKWKVRLTVAPPGGSATRYEQTLGDGDEPVQVTFDAVDFGAVDGDISFSVVAFDSVGRVSPEDTATLTIDRTPPLLTLIAPDPTQRVLSRPDDLEPVSLATIEVDFSVAQNDAVGELTLTLDAEAPVVEPVASPVIFPRSSLPAGHHVAVFAGTDVAGNLGSVDYAFDVVTAAVPTVTVDPPTAAPYTVTASDIGVTISDSSGGGNVILETFAASVGGSAVASASSGVLAAAISHVVFPAFPLPQGLFYLQATFTDAFGYVVVSSRVLYSADALGPTLTLGVRTAAGAVESCDSLGASCLADTLPFDPATRRITLDRTAVNPTCGGFGPCSPDGTDLFFTLTQCVNSDPALETCPVTVRLQSRLAGDPTWADVFGGSFASNDMSTASIVGTPELEPGAIRELRLVTEDSNHNVAISNSVFLTIDFAGVVVEVERLDAALGATGDLLADDRYFGIAEDTLNPATGRFTTNFRAHLTAYGVMPTSVRLAVDNTAGTSSTEVPVLSAGTIADFVGVELLVATDPASPATNAVTLQAMCGTDPCGQRDYAGVVADITAPTYQFDRCSLCTLGVPLVGGSCPAACLSGNDTDPNDNIAGVGSFAVWNLALDADHDGANGFNASPIAVKISGVENGRTVRLDTDLGSLTGNVTSAAGCPSAATCRASFAGLTASHLAGIAVRRITVGFTDRAGNVAVPDVVRIDAAHESIYARTDVVAPAGVTAHACIGESTAPVTGSDPAMLEDATCAAACVTTGACNRTAASAALTWSAPGDDGSAGGNAVVSYVIGIAALGIPYGATTYASCTELTPSGPFETTAVLPGTPQAPGSVEQLAAPGLFPHRDYCFLVVATDDAGNSSPAGAFVTRRKIPLVTTPAIQGFDGIVRDDAQAAGAFRVEPSSPPDFGAFAVSLPDLDADGRDDFAVTQLTSGSVQLYLSSSGGFAPAVTINAPAIAYSGSFGVAVAGGDFDGDGANDLVICDASLATSGFAGAGAQGGALFIYYGVPGAGIARNLNTTTPQVPSLHPDVSLLGRASTQLCANLQLGDVTGDDLVDLVATTASTAAAPRVYVIAGGSRARLPVGVSSFDPTADPDLVIAPDPASTDFPQRLAIGDYDADGTDELAVADATRVFTYDGAALTTIVAHPTATGFGVALATVREPRGTPGDWLLVGTADDMVVVLASGFMSASYPLASYVTLDGTGWDGAPAPRFGRSLASLGDFDGNGGVDIAVGPGAASSGGPYGTYIYSFDSDTDVFAKRAILLGGPGFGSTLVGVRAYSPGAGVARSQLLVVQRFAARLFMFR